MKESPEGSKITGMGRREALGLIGAAILIACGATTKPYREDEKTEYSSDFIDFECLPKNPEYVYLLLFEQEPYDGNRSDDFIAQAAHLVGYKDPLYWHAEVVYFDTNKGEWMTIGCRPPTCSSDFPVYKLMNQFEGYTAHVRQLHIPLEKQAQAREWFEENLQGQDYELAGPRSTNCTDAVVGLGRQAEVQNIRSVRRVTRNELREAFGINDFLLRWDLSSVDSVVKRDSIIFPNALENVGRYMGKMQF